MRRETIAILARYSTKKDNKAIGFKNPSSLHHWWESGVERTGTITIAPGHTLVGWTIVNHDTRVVEASGLTKQVTHTFTFVTMLNCPYYDLIVVTDKGGQLFDRAFDKEFWVTPVIPRSGYTTTWNTSGDKNGGNTDRAGQSVLATGELSARLNPYHWKSDDPADPLIIVLDGLHITSSSLEAFRCTAFQNTIIFGCLDENDYGCFMEKTGTGQHFRYMLHEPNDATKRTQNVWIAGLRGKGTYPTVSTGDTFVRIEATRDATNNEATCVHDNIILHSCLGEDCSEEIYYVGTSDDELSGGLGYPYQTNCYYAFLRGRNGGNEVFQIGTNRNFEVSRCEFSNGGLRNQNLHENLVQISDGCVDGYFYQNKLRQGQHNMIFWSTGRTGGHMEFFGNDIDSDGKDADGFNILFRADLHASNPSVSGIFKHNTVRHAAGTCLSLYEATATDWDRIQLVDNLIIGPTTTPLYENGSGVDPTHVDVDNLMLTDISLALFKNAAAKNYDLASLLSPAFRPDSGHALTHVYGDRDIEGYKYINAACGAYSGVKLLM